MIGQGSPFNSDKATNHRNRAKVKNLWSGTGLGVAASIFFLLLAQLTLLCFNRSSKSAATEIQELSLPARNHSEKPLVANNKSLLSQDITKLQSNRVVVRRASHGIGDTFLGSHKANWPIQESRDRKRDPNPFQVRFTWGGGQASRWSGTIRLIDPTAKAEKPNEEDTPSSSSSPFPPLDSPEQNSAEKTQPEFSNLQILSYRTDAPGSILSTNKAISIGPTGKVNFYAFQIDIQNLDQETDQLDIKFQNTDDPTVSIHKRVAIKDILTKKWNHRLDDTGNGFWIQRATGNEITFHSTKKKECFVPGAKFEMGVKTHLIGYSEQKLDFDIRLVSNLPNRKVIWKDSGKVSLDEFSYGMIGPFSINAGPDPGVYQLEVDITLPNSNLDFFSSKKKISRSCQWVVVGDPKWLNPYLTHIDFSKNRLAQNGPSTNHPTKLFDPVQDYLQSKTRRQSWDTSPKDVRSKLWKLDGADLNQNGRLRIGMPRIPRFRGIWPSSESTVSRSPLSLEIEPGKSHTLSINLAKNRFGPAVLEVQREGSGPLKLGVTWVNSEENGGKRKISGQAGFFLPEPDWTSEFDSLENLDDPRKQILRRVVWLPADNTEGTYQLILSNKSSNKTIRINRLELFSLLPQTNSAESNSLASRELENQFTKLARKPFRRRKIGRYLDVSGFFENFQAQKSYSPQAGSKVNNWETMYLGTVRLMDFMKRSGTSNIWIPVRTQGGSLYPSTYSPTSPRSDDSIFNNQSHQTDRLDTLCLLLQSFQPARLGLSPIIDFSGTSQAAQRLIASGRKLQLKELNKTASKPGQHYNPLNPRYQETVIRTIQEIGRKYGQHSSFSSLAIRLSPESNLLLPGEEYPLDLESFRSFLRDTKTKWPGPDPLEKTSSEQRYHWLMTQHRSDWNSWRSSRLFEFYSRIAKQFDLAVSQSGRTEGKIPVYFVFDRWQQNEQFQTAGAPLLSQKFDWKKQMSVVGIDIQKFNQPEAPGFLLSWRHPPSEVFSERNKGRSIGRDQGLWDELKGIPKLGIVTGIRSEMQQIQSPASFSGNPKTQQESVLVFNRPGAQSTQSWSQALWQRDLESLAHGSWGIPTTDNPPTQAFCTAFSSLPEASYRTVIKDQGHSVILRETAIGNQVIRYMVNAAPWPVEVQLRSEAEENNRWFNLVTGTEIKTLQRSAPENSKKATQIRLIKLPPFSMLSLYSRKDRITSIDIRSPKSVIENLSKHKNLLFAKLRNLQQIAPINGLKNPGFESSKEDETPTGWSFGGSPGDTSNKPSVKITSDASHTDSKSLQVDNNGKVLWIRSEPIAVPETGRISVTAWIKTSKQSEKGKLRVCIDGRHKAGKSFYRFAEIQLNQNSKQEDPTWQPVVVHFDGIPSSKLHWVRIGFDFFEKGKLHIDSVQVFDRWIDGKGQKALASRLGLVAYALKNKKSAFAGYQLLDHYWMDFLDHFGPNKNQHSDRRNIAKKNPNKNLQPIIRSAKSGSTREQSR